MGGYGRNMEERERELHSVFRGVPLKSRLLKCPSYNPDENPASDKASAKSLTLRCA